MSQRHASSRPRARSVGAPPVVALPEPGRLEDPVLAAAYGCVMDLGLRRTTMAEVARRAGISRMTLYRRHDDLHRLLAALLEAELGAVAAAVGAQASALPTARERVTAAVAGTTRAVADHPLMRRVLELDPEELLPLVVDRLGSTQRALRDELARSIAEGLPGTGDGSVRDADPALLALTVLVTAQSFVFSERIVRGADPRAYDEIALLVDRYLAPEEAAS